MPFIRTDASFAEASGEPSLPTRRTDIWPSLSFSPAFFSCELHAQQREVPLSLAGVRRHTSSVCERCNNAETGMARRAGASCARSRWGASSGSLKASCVVLEAGRRRRPSEKVLLPALRNPATCSASGNNQHKADASEREWDDRHRRFRRRRRRERELEPLPPQLAYVYLPSVFPIDGQRYDETRRYGRNKATKALGRQRDFDTSGSSDGGSSCDSSDEDDHVPLPMKTITMRSQRMRSLAAMSKLQHDAAITIQREYRFYRRLQTNRNRRNQRLARQAHAFLDVFLLQEVTSLVPVCLLEVLRETCAQEAVTTKRRENLAESLAGSVLGLLVDECIRDVFHSVLQAMVKSYLAQQLDLSRAATPTTLAVATDILDDWTKELVAELLPEVLVELASEYTARQQHEVLWETLLQNELQSVASDTMADLAKVGAMQKSTSS